MASSRRAPWELVSADPGAKTDVLEVHRDGENPEWRKLTLEQLQESTGPGVKCKAISFTEAGDTTYTGTVEIPAGAVLLNIQFVTTVLWDDGTSAVLNIGDDDDADGWFAAVSVKATDLAVGEVLDISNAENWGGKQGAYLVAATGRKGRTTAGVDSGVYYGAASEVIGVITTGAQDGSAGRSFMFVTYADPDATAATAA